MNLPDDIEMLMEHYCMQRGINVPLTEEAISEVMQRMEQCGLLTKDEVVTYTEV